MPDFPTYPTRTNAEQAAMGYFAAWMRAHSDGGRDPFIRFHSRFLDGTNGGYHSVRIEVDGVILAVMPDSAARAMEAGIELARRQVEEQSSS